MIIQPPIKSEHAEQREFVEWFRKTFPKDLIWATPNGGERSPRVALQMKLEGVVRGIPDLYVRKWQLWIEMKKIGGRVEQHQALIHYYLRECGDTVFVCYGQEDAKRQVLKFMSEKY